jgi:hypothetical protein
MFAKAKQTLQKTAKQTWMYVAILLFSSRSSACIYFIVYTIKKIPVVCPASFFSFYILYCGVAFFLDVAFFWRGGVFLFFLISLRCVSFFIVHQRFGHQFWKCHFSKCRHSSIPVFAPLKFIQQLLLGVLRVLSWLFGF